MCHTSGGLTCTEAAHSVPIDLAMRSVAKREQFAEDTGEVLALHQSGSLKVARTPEFVEQIHDEIERGRAAGLDIQSVSPTQAERLAPFFHAEAALAMWYTSS